MGVGFRLLVGFYLLGDSSVGEGERGLQFNPSLVVLAMVRLHNSKGNIKRSQLLLQVIDIPYNNCIPRLGLFGLEPRIPPLSY